jgi:hypothetical protein
MIITQMGEVIVAVYGTPLHSNSMWQYPDEEQGLISIGEVAIVQGDVLHVVMIVSIGDEISVV